MEIHVAEYLVRRCPLSRFSLSALVASPSSLGPTSWSISQVTKPMHLPVHHILPQSCTPLATASTTSQTSPTWPSWRSLTWRSGLTFFQEIGIWLLFCSNDIHSFDSISFLYLCPKMQTVTFRGNPIADAADYQERIHRYFPRWRSFSFENRIERRIFFQTQESWPNAEEVQVGV